MSQVAFDRLVMSQNYDKTNLKLDLENKATNNSRKRKIFGTLHSPATLLQSPDLKLLKLGSPELEKIIINNNGFLPTPLTPSGSSSSLIQTGENNADDQESFARGFIEALQKLQEQDVNVPTPSSTKVWEGTTDTRTEAIPAVNPANSKPSSVSPARWQTDHNRNSVPVITNRYDRCTPPISRHSATPPVLVNFPTASSMSAVTTMGMTSVPHASTSYITRPDMPPQPNRTQQTTHSLTTSGMTLPTPITSSTSIANLDPILIKSEEDTIMTTPSHSQNPDIHLDMNPINLEVQEHIKHQRKKLRNRLAAQRCRKRKIEREDTLKAKVKELKQKNTDLTSVSRDLRMQVCELKQQVMQHVNQGCSVFLKDSDTDKTENSG